MIDDPLAQLYNDAMALFAPMAATGKYKLLRPDYSADNTFERTIASGLPTRMDPSRVYPKPDIAGPNQYSVFMNRRLPEIGDVLIPNTEGGTTATILSTDSKDEMNAFCTDRIGSLGTNRKNVVFSNVRFSIFGQHSPEVALNDEMSASQTYMSARAAIWWRQGLEIGWYLIETPTYNGESMGHKNIWKITQITGTFPLAILDLEPAK